MREQIHPAVLSITEMARLLALSRQTVNRRIADGTFDAIRIGTTIRIRRDSVDAILAGNDQQGAQS